jgi:hypothetical protein
VRRVPSLLTGEGKEPGARIASDWALSLLETQPFEAQNV